MLLSQRRMFASVSVVLCALHLAACTTLTPELQTAALVRQAEAAMGSEALSTLTVTGRGSGASVGQAYAPGTAWPRLKLTALSRAMNFDDASFREEYIRSRSEALGGGTEPPFGDGEARGVVLAREGHAWDLAGTATLANPASWPARVHDLWTFTPQGAIKAAARLGARPGVRRAFLRRWDTLSVEMPGQFSATLVLEANGLISRIESVQPHAVLGELGVVTEFHDYRPYGELMFPSRITQTQGGFDALDLAVSAASANQTVEITVPEDVRGASEVVSIEALADGVWLLAGGTHHSVAIELAQQIVLVEAPLHEGRARAVLATANRLVPGKKVRTVINTHHHFDHAGGLRLAAAEGAALVTSVQAQRYFEAAFAQVPARAPDTLARAGVKPVFIGVEDKTVLVDARRPIEIHRLQGSLHASGLLAVWLPREQLLVEADAYTPGAAGAPPPEKPDANQLNLVQNLARLGLVPKRIVPLHGRVVPAAALREPAARRPAP